MINEDRCEKVKRVFSVRNNIKKPQPSKRRDSTVEPMKKASSSRQVLKRDLSSRRNILAEPLYKNTSFTNRSRSKSPRSLSPHLPNKGKSDRVIRAYTPSSSSNKYSPVIHLTPFKKLSKLSDSNKRLDTKLPRSLSRENVGSYSILLNPNLNNVLIRNPSYIKNTPRDRYKEALQNKEETARFKSLGLNSYDFNSITTPPDEMEMQGRESPFAKVVEPRLNSYLNLSSEDKESPKIGYNQITDFENNARISEVEPEPSYPDLDILGNPTKSPHFWRNFKQHKKFPIQILSKDASRIDRGRRQVALKRLDII
jgi:hypothetical protein